ncbi:DNA double-strand break repair protein Mre11 [Halalkalicoccus ordinarius]|uniref:DNA double-strand break repair protein Mre11 n=1 Tax=Halalkalicoccus ordinarius TaxID=3116651 RepID=UPI00300F099A
MTRVIHTGDTHIGYRQYHSAERRADFLSAFERVIEDAIDAEVDAVVHAGDLFHDRRPDLGDLLGTLDALRTLDDAGIPFLAVVGNHEGTREGQWLDLFERLGLATRLDDSGTEIGETTFYGLDHVPQSRREELEYAFEPPNTEHAALVTHGLFEPFAYADWDTEELLERSSVAFDAMLLGDNHHPDRAQVGETWVTYCGSTERTSAAERDDRGYNLVTFGSEDGSTGDDVHITRRGLPTREFVFVDVELGEGKGAERVLERVGQHDLADRVVVVTVEGEGNAITPADVESFARDRGALIARVNDAREIEAEGDVTVSFADPDAAVRESIRDLGLSEAASDIDETVRASKVADSNVRETVEERVRTLLEEDPDAFDGGEIGPSEDETAADEPADPDGTGTDVAETTEVAEDAATDGIENANVGTVDAETAENADDDGVHDVEAAEVAEGPGGTGDGQSSMEEYL